MKYTEVQKNLESYRKTSKKIGAEIAEYEAKIRDLRVKKTSVDKHISLSETFIKEKDIKIREIKDKITVIKTKVSTSLTQKETLKKAYL